MIQSLKGTTLSFITEGSGSEGTSDRDACSMAVAAAEELALGEELAGSPSSLEDIVGPKKNLDLF